MTEIGRIWIKTWQIACRTDDIRKPGDFHFYRVAQLSWLVFRQGTVGQGASGRLPPARPALGALTHAFKND